MRYITPSLAVIVVLFNLVILYEWLTGSLRISNFSPLFVPTAPSTALFFILLGVVTWLSRRKIVSAVLHYFLQTATVLVLALSTFLLLQYAFDTYAGFTLDIEQLLVKAVKSDQGFVTGRMSYLTAVLFILVSSAILTRYFFSLPDKWRHILANIFSACAFSVALVITVGYWYGQPILYGGITVPVALPTGISFLIITSALLFSAPEGFFLYITTGGSVFARVCRWVLPIPIFIILVVGWIEMLAFQTAGKLQAPVIVSVSGIATALFIVAATLVSARRIQTVIDRNERDLKLQADLLDTEGDVVYCHDLEGNFIFANRVAYETRGYTKEEILNMNVRDLILPEYAGLVASGIKEVVENGQATFESAHVHKNGTLIPVEVMAQVTQQQGRTVILAVSRDISGRKQAEEALKRSQETLSLIFNNTSEMIMLLRVEKDNELRVIAVNKAQMESFKRRVIELTRDQIIGKPLESAFFKMGLTAEEIRRRMQIYNKVIANKQPVTDNAELMTPQGIMYLETVRTPVLDDSGNCTHVLRMSRDMTERKRAEAALKESERKYSTLVERSNDGIVTVSGGVVTFYNSQATNLFGYGSEELLGRPFIDFIAQPCRQLVMDRYVRRMRGEQVPNRYEIEVIKKDGNLLPVEISASLIDFGGKTSDMVIIRDISERRKAEEQLRLQAQLLDNEMDGIIAIDLESNIIYANPASCEMHGYSREELYSMNLGQLTYQSSAAFIPSRRKALLEKGRLVFEVTHVRKDGTPIPLEVHALVTEWQNKKIILGSERDLRERKKAEEQLSMQAQLLDNELDGVRVVDFDGNTIYANPACYNLRGYTKEEFYSLKLHQLTDHASTGLIPSRMKELSEKGWLVFEVTHLHKDGTPIPIEVHALVTEWQNRKVILSVDRDLRERRQAEQNFKNSLDDSPLGVRIVNESGKLLYANQAILDVYGYDSFEELRSTPARQRYTPASYAEHEKREVKRRRSEFVPSSYEVSILRKDGQVRNLEVYRRNVLWNGENNFQVIYHDITERRKAEDAIRLNEARLESLLRITQHKADSTRELLNYALEEALKLTSSKFGYIFNYDENRKEFEINTWSKDVMKDCGIKEKQIIFPLDTTGLWGEVVRQRKPLMLNDYAAPDPLKKGYPEGHIPIYRWMSIPVFSDDKIVAAAGVANKETDYEDSDVCQMQLLMDGVWKHSMLRQAEETLKEKEIQLEIQKLKEEKARSEKMAIIGQMSSMFAHEIRNPLGIITNCLYYLKTYMKVDDDKFLLHLDLANKAIYSASAIVEDLLDYARPKTPVLKPVMLNYIIEAALSRVQIGNIEIVKEFSQDLPPLQADPEMLQRVFINLIQNAVQAMPGVGILRLGSSRYGEWQEATVTDSGGGMTREVQENLFQPLFSTKVKGVGLGLYIARQIITQHAGNIEVKSEPGKGTTMVVSLPVEKEKRRDYQI